MVGESSIDKISGRNSCSVCLRSHRRPWSRLGARANADNGEDQLPHRSLRPIRAEFRSPARSKRRRCRSSPTRSTARHPRRRPSEQARSRRRDRPALVRSQIRLCRPARYAKLSGWPVVRAPGSTKGASAHARVCDHAGSFGTRDVAPRRLAFRQPNDVATRDEGSFAAK
jgi:hypothetical protein